MSRPKMDGVIIHAITLVPQAQFVVAFFVSHGICDENEMLCGIVHDRWTQTSVISLAECTNGMNWTDLKELGGNVLVHVVMFRQLERHAQPTLDTLIRSIIDEMTQ